MKEIVNQFISEKYTIVRDVIPKEFCEIIVNYAKFQALYDFTPESEINAQVPGTHSRYADFLMEAFLISLQPIIEKNINRALLPAYSYYRVYKEGDKLDPHIDRSACEVSATVAFGWPDSNPWPFKLSNDKTYSDGDEESYIASSEETTIVVSLNPGDLLIYAGPLVKHWRDPLDSIAYVQAFFHYVYIDGPNTLHQFDGRDAIGVPKISSGFEYFKYSDLMNAMLTHLEAGKKY
ncbi:MAG: hypothetical protein ACYC0J_08240 [Gammaproteobacteria bacterium]